MLTDSQKSLRGLFATAQIIDDPTEREGAIRFIATHLQQQGREDIIAVLLQDHHANEDGDAAAATALIPDLLASQRQVFDSYLIKHAPTLCTISYHILGRKDSSLIQKMTAIYVLTWIIDKWSIGDRRFAHDLLHRLEDLAPTLEEDNNTAVMNLCSEIHALLQNAEEGIRIR